MGVFGLCFRFLERICLRSREAMLMVAVSMVAEISLEMEAWYACAAC
jgi:hypothetical protein